MPGSLASTSYESRLYGAVVEYWCQEGYSSRGDDNSSVSTCGADGTWLPEIFNCEWVKL